MTETQLVKYGGDEYTLKIYRFERVKEKAYGRLHNLLHGPIEMM